MVLAHQLSVQTAGDCLICNEEYTHPHSHSIDPSFVHSIPQRYNYIITPVGGLTLALQIAVGSNLHSVLHLYRIIMQDSSTDCSIAMHWGHINKKYLFIIQI